MAEAAKNPRGRVYQCQKCNNNNIYTGEKSKVLLHFYRKHVAIDSVPFYCNICKFVTTSEKELFNHVLPKHYPSHLATVNAMLTNGEIVNESASLIKNTNVHIPTNLEIIRLSKEESSVVFAQRKKTKNSPDIIKRAMMENEIPSSPTNTENILNDILEDQCLSPFSLNGTDMLNKEAVIVGSAPRKSVYVVEDNLDKMSDSPYNSSSSSSSSSTTSSTSNSAVVEELKFVKNEIKMLGVVMEEFLHDLEKLTDIVKNTTKQSNTIATQTEKIPLLPTPHYPQSTPTPHYPQPTPTPPIQNATNRYKPYNKSNTHIRF